MKEGISIITGIGFAILAITIIAFPYFAVFIAIGYLLTKETLDEKDN